MYIVLRADLYGRNERYPRRSPARYYGSKSSFILLTMYNEMITRLSLGEKKRDFHKPSFTQFLRTLSRGGGRQVPEYMQVQTYVACDENTFSDVIPRFRQVLERVHGLSPKVGDWLHTLNGRPGKGATRSILRPFCSNHRTRRFLHAPICYFPCPKRKRSGLIG